MKTMSDLDYVKLFAGKLRENSELFKQQKMLIESQMKASSSLFSNMFSDNNFKEDARKYLKNVKLF